MSALARYFLAAGKNVYGYDRVSTRLTDELTVEGAGIHFTEDLIFIKENFPDKDRILVIYTPAIPEEHIELVFFRRGGYNVVKRAEVLGILSGSERCIAVAGTHGKTTISTMIAHLLKFSDVPCNAFLGGISKNYNTNTLLAGKDAWMVLEADEYDRSFLKLFPEIAVVSSCDPDHLDIYGTYENLKTAFCEFISQVSEGGSLVLREGTDLDCEKQAGLKRLNYSLDRSSGYYAFNMRNRGGYYRFDVQAGESEIKDVDLGIPGRINIENALAAVCVGKIVGIADENIREAMASFKGVRRRFDVRIHRDDLVYIDDYAHHPRELEACIGSVRENFPGKKITGIFQPHLYSRTRDFAKGFASSLSQLDDLILMDIYPAREEPISGVSSRMIFDRVDLAEKILISKEQLIPVMQEKKPEVLLTLGAGDIDQLVEPITKMLEKNR